MFKTKNDKNNFNSYIIVGLAILFLFLLYLYLFSNINQCQFIFEKSGCNQVKKPKKVELKNRSDNLGKYLGVNDKEIFISFDENKNNKNNVVVFKKENNNKFIKKENISVPYIIDDNIVDNADSSNNIYFQNYNNYYRMRNQEDVNEDENVSGYEEMDEEGVDDFDEASVVNNNWVYDLIFSYYGNYNDSFYDNYSEMAEFINLEIDMYNMEIISNKLLEYTKINSKVSTNSNLLLLNSNEFLKVYNNKNGKWVKNDKLSNIPSTPFSTFCHNDNTVFITNSNDRSIIDIYNKKKKGGFVKSEKSIISNNGETVYSLALKGDNLIVNYSNLFINSFEPNIKLYTKKDDNWKLSGEMSDKKNGYKNINMTLNNDYLIVYYKIMDDDVISNNVYIRNKKRNNSNSYKIVIYKNNNKFKIFTEINNLPKSEMPLMISSTENNLYVLSENKKTQKKSVYEY